MFHRRFGLDAEILVVVVFGVQIFGLRGRRPRRGMSDVVDERLVAADVHAFVLDEVRDGSRWFPKKNKGSVR